MPSSKKRHYLFALQEMELIIRKLEKNDTQDYNVDYEQLCDMRNIAFVELMRTKMPFIVSPEDNVVRIAIDGEKYEMDLDHLKEFVGETDYKNLISMTDFKGIDDATEEDAVEVARFKSAYERLKNNILEQLDKETREEITIVDYPATQTSVVTTKQRPALPRKYRIPEADTYAVNCVEIAFAGLEVGVGNTYTAIMCANTLAMKYKVAYLELNKVGHMQSLERWMAGSDGHMLGQMRILNVDYYYDIDYLTFVSDFRDSYDFVIINFGPQSENENITQYIASSKKILVASGIDWRLAAIENFEETCDYDNSNAIIYLIPFADEDTVKIVKDIVKGNEVYAVPYNKNPMEPSEEVRELFEKIIPTNKKASVSQKKWLGFKKNQ